MSKRVLKIAGITAGSLIAVLYILFLSAPLFLNGVLNSYGADISKMVEEASGFKLKLENLQILTTPKLTAGLKAGHIEVSLPKSFFLQIMYRVKYLCYLCLCVKLK